MALSQTAIEVRAWMSSYIPHQTMDVITYICDMILVYGTDTDASVITMPRLLKMGVYQVNEFEQSSKYFTGNMRAPVLKKNA